MPAFITRLIVYLAISQLVSLNRKTWGVMGVKCHWLRSSSWANSPGICPRLLIAVTHSLWVTMSC